MKKIYVVIGSWGDYSDRTEWIVGAFTNEAKAQNYILRASELARQAYAVGAKMSWMTDAIREKQKIEYAKLLLYDTHAPKYGDGSTYCVEYRYEETELI